MSGSGVCKPNHVIVETCSWTLRESRYVALKVYVNSSKVHRELPIYQHLNQIQSNHAGRRCLRLLLDSFQVAGPAGKHFCLVHQPLGMSLYDMKMRARGKVFSKDVLRISVRQLLAALDYLHKDAHVMHTGDYIHGQRNHR